MPETALKLLLKYKKIQKIKLYFKMNIKIKKSLAKRSFKGERGIRTLGPLAESTDFESVPIDQLWHLSDGKEFSKCFFY